MKKVLALLAVCGGASGARAQTSTVDHQPHFTVDRLAPAPGPGAFLAVEDAQVARHLGISVTLVSSLITRPLVIRMLGKDQTLTEPVALRLGLDAGAAVGLWGWLQLGAALPIVGFQDGDRLRGLDLDEMGAEDELAAFTVGDLRLHAKATLLEPYRGYGPGLAADVVVTLPTGDDGDFAGEASVVAEARAIASLRAPRWAVAVNAGPRLRGDKVRFFNPNLVLGHELAWGVAASARLPLWRRLEPTALAEVAGAYGGADGPSPAEWRLGLRARVSPAWTAGVAGGAGIGDARAIGAPVWRGAVELRWDRAPRADLDGDGVPDAADRCPDTPEDLDGFEDGDGCPDLDNDGDGVPDSGDQCPLEAEDLDRFRDYDGCPEPDNDGDGILDGADRCPVEAEDRDGFSDDDGCPDKDNDNDRVADELDQCPDEPEDADDHDDMDGCPDLDDDGDGVPDAKDRCPSEAEDRDGWLDDDGCFDGDDDRDGVPDERDRCPDAAETITSPEDRDADGCPDGRAMAEARGGAVWLSAVARAELAGGPQVARVAAAIAVAARRAGWDGVAPGTDVLIVTVPGDAPVWSPLAQRRSAALVAALAAEGLRARVEAVSRPTGVTVRATPEALASAGMVKIRGR